MQRWLSSIDADLDSGDFNVDHIIPKFWGGIDHPRNYFLLCGSLNKSLGEWITKEKMAFIGKKNRAAASKFAKFMTAQTLRHVDVNDDSYIFS